MTPAKQGRELALSIAGANCRVLPAVGHMVMTEAPDETIDALADFLRMPANVALAADPAEAALSGQR
jgi:pimeloyl-ACP methyl ester carboxylesterase